MNTPEADGAALRRAFNRAAETFPASVSQFLDASKSGKAQLAVLMAWWGEFYTAVRDTTAGLAVLAENAKLRESVAALRDALMPFALKDDDIGKPGHRRSESFTVLLHTDDCDLAAAVLAQTEAA